nr:protein eds1b [Quercus suber]
MRELFLPRVWRGVETYVAKLDTEIRDFQSLREFLVTCTLKLEELGIFCKHILQIMEAIPVAPSKPHLAFGSCLAIHSHSRNVVEEFSGQHLYILLLSTTERTRLCLRVVGELEKRKIGNKDSIDLKKTDIGKAMKYLLEDYQLNCGYCGLDCYDTFKLQESSKDFDANVKRLELAGIWDEIVEFLKRYELPDAFECQNDWIDLGTRTVWVMTTKNSPQEICLVRYRQLLDCMRPNQVVWEPYQDDLAHLPPFCVAGRDGDMSPTHAYFGWYDRVTWRFVDHTSASLFIMVASHKKMLTQYPVGSPMYKHILAVLKYVECLHRITAKLPLEETDGANPHATEDTERPSTSSNRASHSHGQHGAPHQVVSRSDPPPPPHASPMPEFPPPPHASPATEFPPRPHASPFPDIPPRTAYAVPDLEIPLPTAHASSHPEIPSHTPRTFFDPAHLSFTPPCFDLDYDFSQPPPIMHTQSPSYSIGHIDHVPPHSHSMSFMPTPGLHIDPMTTGLTHTSFATPSSPAVVVVGLQSPPQGRPKHTTKAPPCGTGGHKAGHKTGPTQHEEPHQGDVVLPPPPTKHYRRQHKRKMH